MFFRLPGWQFLRGAAGAVIIGFLLDGIEAWGEESQHEFSILATIGHTTITGLTAGWASPPSGLALVRLSARACESACEHRSQYQIII